MLPNTCRARVLLMMSDHSDLLMELIFIFPTLAPLLGGASSVALPKSALRAIGRTVSLDEYALRGSPLIFYHIIRHLGSHILQGAASGDLTRRSIANVIWILRFGIEPEAVLRAMSRANYFIRPTLLAYRHREDWEKQIRRSAAVVAFYCGEHAPAGCFAQPSLRVASFFHALDKNRHMPALWLPTGGHCAGGPNAADDTDGACVLFAQLPRPCKVLCLQFLSNLPHVAFELIYQFPTIASVLVEGSDATKVHIPTMCWTRTFVDMGRSLDLAEYACGPRGPLYFGTFPLRAVYHITRFLGAALLQGAASTSVHKRSIGNVISLLRFRGMSFDDVRKAELKANSIFRPILESYRRNDDWQERVQISTNLLKYYCDGECLFPDLNMRVERFLPRIPLEPRNTA
eukprot:GEMP01037051.1.p1 GENE.GEMP01037051.1~~GEMP01037051.1.p1  ORF type:complete len:402 (+),score=84.19 GEMP01037051.1:371-1576(+)